MDVSFEHYRIFYYVAKYGSFTQAAKALLNSQPNITRVIKQLEKELGCPLFIRANRHIRLTPEGQRLFEHVAAAYAHLKAGEEELLMEKSLEKGSVAISVSEVALHTVLLSVLQKFRASYPGIRIRISNDTTPQAVRNLKNGLVDLAVVTTPVEPSSLLEETLILPIQEVAVCGRAFKGLSGKLVSLQELVQFPVISLGEETSTHRFYADYFAQNELVLQPDIEAATADQILSMVKADLGIGFVPETFLQEASLEDSVYQLSLVEPIPPRAVCMLKRKEQALSLAGCVLEKMLLANR